MLVKKLEEILPHGSGINSNWEFTGHKKYGVRDNISFEPENFKKITCKNWFDAMNDNGYYDGVMPFKFTITEVENGKLEFDKITCNEKKKKSFYGLREYLEDTIQQALDKHNDAISYKMAGLTFKF